MKIIKSIPKRNYIMPFILTANIIFLAALLFRKDKNQNDVLSFYTSIPKPVFSVPEGIYDQPFELEINAPLEYDIYYTIDGSTPTSHSYRYREPIKIDPNTNSNKDILYISTSLKWRSPYGKQNHSTVIRARCIKSGEGYGPVKNIVYSSSKISQHLGFQVVHLLIEPDSLFSPERGIYILGQKYYSKKMLTANGKLPDLKQWYRYPANYHQRGKRWQRPATFILMDLSGKTLHEQNITLSINGVGSRAWSAKSLRIIPDNQIDTVIRNTCLNELPDTTYKGLVLRTSGSDYSPTMFRDVLIHRLVNGTKVDIQAYAPSVLYINGNYWGIHNICERMDEHFLAVKYASTLQNITIINYHDEAKEPFSIKYGQESSIHSFKELLNFIRDNSLSENEAYHAVSSQIDVDNFIDYMILQTFFANYDWPNNNVRFYRFDRQTESMKQQGIEDGKWRWLFYDLDGCMDYHPSINMFETLQSAFSQEFITQIFFEFMKNEDFKKKFIVRYEYLIKNHLTTENIIEKINFFEAKYRSEMKRHLYRWRQESNIQYWQQNVDKMKNFAKERPAIVLNQLKELY